MKYFMIANVGTMLESAYARAYPRHMFLMQVYQKAPESYRMTVQHLCEKAGTTVMADNGAHEGIICEDGEYLKFIEETQPQYAVLPDLIGQDWMKSRDRSLQFDAKMLAVAPNTRAIFAGQGRSSEETLIAYRWAMLHLNQEHYLMGLGQAYLRWETPTRKGEAARWELFRNIIEFGYPERPFHILGARWNACDFFSQIPCVQSIDSIKPWKSADCGDRYPARISDSFTEPDFRNELHCGRDMLLNDSVDAFCRAYGCDLD